ncbi:MAG TPA: cysteine--tRNA ligase [Thermomicrobiales bacterium]|nr:cysteine--tRNA ligase [Thermomicrobiales bacterium]
MRLYNTQSESTEEVVPRDGHIGIYVCGVTPYDTTHAGHAFTYIVYDVLIRYLRAQGVRVTYVQNVTDIDDDVLRKAKELGVDWKDLGRRETDRFLQDMRDLHALPPDHYVAATDHIPEVIAITSKLVDLGLAYESSGSVYYSVEKDPDFGKLSHLAKDEMLPVANEHGNFPDDPKKRNPIDFVLWQAMAPGEPFWESPWGPGRPGWHIECSAMSTKYLGSQVDIHGGGSDLIFPHHECEIAQTEPVTGTEPFVRYWMHAAMVAYQGEKMSKSLGNLVKVSDVFQTYSSDALRLYLLSNHYRTPWEFEDDRLDDWASVADALTEAAEVQVSGIGDALDTRVLRDRFFTALDNDLDTPTAIAVLQEFGQAILEAPEDDDIRDAQSELRELGEILGLTLRDA